MATANGYYAAYLRDGKVYIKDLSAPECDKVSRCLPLPDLFPHTVLSLSTLQPRLLAVSNGSQILLLDAPDGKSQRIIPGNGRMITALAWSLERPGLLVSGALDGTLSLVDLEKPGVLGAQLRVDGACSAIACGSKNETEFVSIHDGKIVVSKKDSGTLRTVRVFGRGDENWKSLSWHPTERRHLLSCALDGTVHLWNLQNLLASPDMNTREDRDSDSSDSEYRFFGNPRGVVDLAQGVSLVFPEGSTSHVQWVGKNGILCLDSSFTRCSICVLDKVTEKAIELWSEELKHNASFLCLSQGNESVAAIAAYSSGIERVEIPQRVLHDIGLGSTNSANASPGLLDDESQHSRQSSSVLNGVKPVLISTLKAPKGGFHPTSRQLQRRTLPLKGKHKKTQPKRKSLDSDKHGLPSPPPPMSMTSSLELPKPRDEERSPMPFLSPSIPAQKPSPDDIPVLDDSVKLMPLPRASFDSSIQSASATTQESDDSDDETFVEDMQGSASFLPGGINVPLPKACAALFTRTGELLTFFPPRPKFSSREKDVKHDKHDDPKANAKRVAKLFPSFGNLVGEPRWTDEDDDSGFESTSSVSSHADAAGFQPSFSYFPSSFPSQQSWPARISPTKHSFTEQSPHKVIVSLHGVGDVESLLPASRKLAAQYRVLCDKNENGAGLCRHNADCAEGEGLDEVAGVWRLVALLLEDMVPLAVLTDRHAGNDIPVIARKAIELSETELRGSSVRARLPILAGKLYWSDNPLGAAWIVRAIFDWAESLADTQLLAILSSVLAEAQQHTDQESFLVEESLAARLPSYQRGYFASDGVKSRVRRLTNRSIPILRTDSMATGNAAYESPVKLKRTSTTSSRNLSQPPTPYLASESTTPPFSLPSFGRQNTQLSISGSASPEHHRSSFGAAAKYYAQSISDKFASYGAYGTSPPARKMGTSPSNTNEFSTSFPSGSWGKSVSFASNAKTTKTSMLSTSLDASHEDEGYDSDKTVEDLSLPQTPRDAECAIILKNDRLFDDDVSGGSKGKLLPDDVIAKSRLWCQWYAEQLRSWDLLPQAAELEKVCGMTCLSVPSENPANIDEVGIVPTIAPHASKACTICSIEMTGAQFFCPGCSHTAHLNCLEDFITAMCVEDGQAFACPAGCGCQCADLPFGVTDLAEVKPAREERPKKKASFTDPRHWRARVEGDEW